MASNIRDIRGLIDRFITDSITKLSYLKIRTDLLRSIETHLRKLLERMVF